MKLVDSGEGKVPLISVMAILAISLSVNLPGLAISPVLAELNKVMKSTPLQVQLLNVLPNLVTIPFILGSGKISNASNQLKVLTIGLAIFLATGIGYFFAKSMLVLIILSCLLGVGCGLIIPLAASLISQNFSGKPRATILGTKSGLSNFSVIIATLFVGWVAARNWHLAFTVYFIPLIPLCLVPFMRAGYINKYRSAPILQPVSTATNSGFHFQGKKAKNMMWAAIAIYFTTTYSVMAISYYLPFTMESYGLHSGQVGVATAMFYITATLAGFGLSKIIKYTGVWTLQLGLISATLGLFIIGFIHTYASYILGILIMGFGYGLVQPILYDKTSYFAPNDAKSTQYFSYLLTFNYVGISMVPFIVEFFGVFIKGSKDPSFSYILNGVILSICFIMCIMKHKSFVVQAGVIPVDNDLAKAPSSVIAPGEHIEALNQEVQSSQPIDPMKKAQATLDDTGKAIAELRHEHAEMLKKESELLKEKAEELNEEAQELLDEANELEK